MQATPTSWRMSSLRLVSSDVISGGSNICSLRPTAWPMTYVGRGQHVTTFMPQIHVKIMFTLAYLCILCNARLHWTRTGTLAGGANGGGRLPGEGAVASYALVEPPQKSIATISVMFIPDVLSSFATSMSLDVHCRSSSSSSSSSSMNF